MKNDVKLVETKRPKRQTAAAATAVDKMKVIVALAAVCGMTTKRRTMTMIEHPVCFVTYIISHIICVS